MAELLIYGEIGWDVQASEVVAQIQAMESEDITVRVNSPGGDVYDGLAIMNALIAHPGAITAVVEGLAASAASFIAVGGADRVVVRPTAEIMIHDAMSFVGGNADEMLRAITDLERISDNLASIYATKAGGEASEWRALMKAETWYSAQEAVDIGLADTVEDGRQAAAKSGRHVVMNRFRYQRRRDAPAPTFNRPEGHNRKEDSTMTVLNDLARSLGMTEKTFSDALRRVVNEEVTTTSTVEITYPEGTTVVPTGDVTVEPTGELPPTGLVFAVGEAPEGWSAEVDETTGSLTVTAPAGAEPDTEVTVTVTATGNDEPVEIPVTVTVKAAAGEGRDGDGTAPPAPGENPDTVTLDMDTYRDLQAAATLGWEAKATADKTARVAEVDQWIADGRINVAIRAKAISFMEKDPAGARALYGSNPKNTIPVREIGHGQDPDTVNVGKNADFKSRADKVFRGANLY